MKKPVYVGAEVLDNSKLLMNRELLDVLLHVFEDRLTLMYRDTNSLVLKIKSVDLDKEIVRNYQLYRTLDMFKYSKDNIL